MVRVVVVGSSFKHFELPESDINEIVKLNSDIFAIYELLLQYSLFSSSLAEFSKGMYSKCIDRYLENIDEKFSSSAPFVEAENSVMHISASVVKFVEILPSLCRKALPNGKDVYKSVKLVTNQMYDAADGKYMLLQKLRNAIVHSKVPITVSSGITNLTEVSGSALTLGYYLNFDAFLQKNRCLTVVQKKTLRERKPELCDNRNRVDLVRLVLDVGQSFYNSAVRPLLPLIKEDFLAKKEVYLDKVRSKLKLSDEELKDCHVSFGTDEFLYSALTLRRIDSLVRNPPVLIKSGGIIIAKKDFT